jgi:hypothetical protein
MKTIVISQMAIISMQTTIAIADSRQQRENGKDWQTGAGTGGADWSPM